MVDIWILAVLTTFWLPAQSMGEDLRRQPYGVKMCEELSLKKGCFSTYDKDNLVCVLSRCRATDDAPETTAEIPGPKNMCKRRIPRTNKDMSCGPGKKTNELLTGLVFMNRFPKELRQFVFDSQSITKYQVSDSIKDRYINAMAYSQKNKRLYLVSMKPRVLMSFVLHTLGPSSVQTKSLKNIITWMTLDDVNGAAFTISFIKATRSMISTLRITGYNKKYKFKHSKLTKNSDRISVDPKCRRLFIQTHTKIVSCEYNGSDVKLITRSRTMIHSFFYDTNNGMLYFSRSRKLYRKFQRTELVKKFKNEVKNIIVRNNLIYVVTEKKIEVFCLSQDYPILIKDVFVSLGIRVVHTAFVL